MNWKLAVIMVIISAMAFVLLAIFADQDEMVPLDEAEGGTVASEEKNGEIIHPTTIDAFITPNFASDEDGGVWVIEALPVPEEWKERRAREGNK